MKKIVSTFLVYFILAHGFTQTQQKISTYLLAQYNKTLYDVTLGNNPSAMGLGLQTFFNNKSNFIPTIELTGDIYLEDDKIARLTPDGKTIDDVRSMANLLAGALYQPTQNIYLAILAGPSLINEKILWGIKPSVGFLFFKNRHWMCKISYINIFNRNKITNEDFGSFSFALGLKLF